MLTFQYTWFVFASVLIPSVICVSCDAVGGPDSSGAAGARPCRLPFKFVGEILNSSGHPVYIDKTFEGCPSASEYPPYSNATQGTPAAPVGTTGWCATVAMYEPASPTSQNEWGYCNCTTNPPTSSPTASPSSSPTASPSASPVQLPTGAPQAPSASPMAPPTVAPAVQGTPYPASTVPPSLLVTAPTSSPLGEGRTDSPQATEAPTLSPLREGGSHSPSRSPQFMPTLSPLQEGGTQGPTGSGSQGPTASPSHESNASQPPSTAPNASTAILELFVSSSLLEVPVPLGGMEYLNGVFAAENEGWIVNVLLDYLHATVVEDATRELGDIVLKEVGVSVNLAFATEESIANDELDMNFWAEKVQETQVDDMTINDDRELQARHWELSNPLFSRQLGVQDVVSELCPASTAATSNFTNVMEVLDTLIQGTSPIGSLHDNSNSSYTGTDVSALMTIVHSAARGSEAQYKSLALENIESDDYGAWMLLQVTIGLSAVIPESEFLPSSEIFHRILVDLSRAPFGGDEIAQSEHLSMLGTILLTSDDFLSCNESPLDVKVVQIMRATAPVAHILHPECEKHLEEGLKEDGEEVIDSCLEFLSDDDSTFRGADRASSCFCHKQFLELVLKYNILCRYRAVQLLKKVEELRCDL